MKPMSVEQIGKRIFWGVMILSFHINIGKFMLLPAWVGWYFITNGIERLEKAIPNDAIVHPLSRARVFGLIMMFLSLVGRFIDLFTNGIGDKIMIFYPLSIAIELSVFYFLFTGISMIDPKSRNESSIRIAIYCFLFTAISISLWFLEYLWNDSALYIFLAVVILIFRLWYAGIVRSFCVSYTLENEEDDVE